MGGGDGGIGGGNGMFMPSPRRGPMASALVLTPRRSKQCTSACQALEEEQAAQAGEAAEETPDETAAETPDEADADESCEAWAASGYCHHKVKQINRPLPVTFPVTC